MIIINGRYTILLIFVTNIFPKTSSTNESERSFLQNSEVDKNADGNTDDTSIGT